MGTRWRKFRYGTEEQNPAWSFFGAVFGITLTLFFCALADYEDSGVWLTAGIWTFILSLVSLRHLKHLMENEKRNVLPVEFLDKTYPDFVLVSVLCLFLMNRRLLWRRYIHMTGRILAGYPVISLKLLLLSLFVTGTLAVFLVIMFMAAARHLSKEKLKKTLFFYEMKRLFFRKRKKWLKSWGAYQAARTERGGAAKLFRRRQLWLLCGQGLVFLLVCIYLGAVYYDLEDAMFVIVLAGAAFFLLDLFLLLGSSREIGILLDEIRQIEEDDKVREEPALKPYSIFRRTEEALLAIQENKRESMERGIQSERMKVNLITNVSHDLKTPLTSMIGCIDLLKQVEDLPKEAQDYVTVLSDKAGRLREMIQDVFDMAKATSGGQDLKIERLDMARLLRQTMADMQDRIDASGLHFRIRTEEKEYPFMGDSRKMYRVYQNLIENTLKYSMADSRVYVEIREESGRILTSVKNTSECEMDFTAEEVMERFTRGDKSRSTEGNGLGLAIASSFTQACGGSFQVTLDGDLFKVETGFVRAKPE